ncbi:hypothetical protein ABZP36_021583 [Zizania latifolia]
MDDVFPSSNQPPPPPPPPGSPPHVSIASTAVFLSILFSTFIIVMAFAFYFCRLCRDRTRSDSDSDSGSTRARLGGCSGVSSEPFPVETLPAAFAYDGSSDDGPHGGATATEAAGGGRECAVCLGALRDREMVRLLPACMHVYHAECIDRWLLAAHRTCPLCRSKLDPCKVVAGPPPRDPADQLPV